MCLKVCYNCTIFQNLILKNNTMYTNPFFNLNFVKNIIRINLLNALIIIVNYKPTIENEFLLAKSSVNDFIFLIKHNQNDFGSYV